MASLLSSALRAPARAAALGLAALGALSCGDAAKTYVVLDNRYSGDPALVVYLARWQAVTFATPVPPGASSDVVPTVAASDNPAYVVLAPGWDPASGAPPASILVLASRGGFHVHLNDTLHVPVDDDHFAGRCGAGAPLSQAQADFILGRVFQGQLPGLTYDAPTCTTTPTPGGDGGG